MDPTDWQFTHQRQWGSLDPRPRTDSSRNKQSVKDNKRPHTMMATNEELEHCAPSSHRHKSYNKHRSYGPNPKKINPEMLTSDQGSKPEELSKIDEELARKRRELQLIEKQIFYKRPGIEVPVNPQPSSQNPTTTVMKNDLIAKEFQRFLGVLNKGVDIEMLTKIGKDDNEHPQCILHDQIPVVKEKSGVCKIDSQPFQSGAGQMDRRPCSEETKTAPINQDFSKEGNIHCEDKSAQCRGNHHFGSIRRSRSPPLVEAKKPKLEQHQEELQNILKTIGFSLDSDDVCKLTKRTHERLYGINNGTKQRLDCTGVSKGNQQNVHSDHNHSSSSTSVSDRRHRPSSSSTCLHQHSPSKSFRDGREEETQSSEYLHFGQRSQEKTREQDGDGDENRTASDQYPENPEYLVGYPDSAASSAIPSYTSVQCSEYTAYHSDTSNCVPNDTPFSSSYPPVFSNYSMMTPLCPSADTGVLYGHVYPHPYIHPYPPAGPNTALGHSYFNTDLSLIEGQTGHRPLPPNFTINCHSQTKVADMNMLTKQPAVQIHGQQLSNEKKDLETEEQNSDLSLSEGQTGQQSDLCYLRVIDTAQSSEDPHCQRDTSNSATTTAWNSGSNVIPPSSAQNTGLSQSKPTGQQSAVSAVTKVKFQTEEKKMTEPNKGQREGQRSIQVQQLEVDFPLEKREKRDTSNTATTTARNWQLGLRKEKKRKQIEQKKKKRKRKRKGKKTLEQNPDLPLIKGQTGQKSAINTFNKLKLQTEENKMAEKRKDRNKASKDNRWKSTLWRSTCTGI